MKLSRHKRIMAVIMALSAAVMGGCSPSLAGGSQTFSGEKLIISAEKLQPGRLFDGWGTSLCWWANRLGYSDVLAQKAADAMFGESGLHLNIMRYNIGGGDDPAHHHITRTDSEVPGWLVWDEKAQSYQYDYDADHNQLNVLRRAVLAAGDDALVEVFANSPPYFMTVSGCSSGAVNANDNNLNEDCIDAFAAYLVHVADYIQRHLQIDVASISPMNEPNTGYWGAWSPKQEGCHFDPGQMQSRMITALAQELARQNLTEDILISASDETSPDLQVEAWQSYSEEAKAVIGRINTHTYGENGIRRMGQLAQQKGLYLWMSEVDGDGQAGEDAGEMGAALWLGKKIISDINALQPSAWVLWQVIDSHISAQGHNGNRDTGMVNVNGGFWGLAVADHDREEIVLTQKYYGMGQFTRYIRPGSRLILCNGTTLAAYDEDEKRLTIVAVNDRAASRQICYSLQGFSGLGAARVIRTSGSMADGEHWTHVEDIPTVSGELTAELKGNAITTFVLEGVTLN